MASALDIFQQQEVVASARAAIPPLESSIRVLNHKLLLLIGKPANADMDFQISELPEPIPLPDAGLPSSLLENRPDIQSAWLNLQSADWDVSAARADRLPRLTLTGNAAYDSASFNDLFDNWIVNLAAGISAPLFDGGKRKAEVDRTRAVVDERLATYEKTVFTAIGDVEDAMVKDLYQETYLNALEVQMVATKRALKEARRRYLRGLENYLTVMAEQINLNSLESKLVTERATRVRYRIALYRALGGTWSETLSIRNHPQTSTEL